MNGMNWRDFVDSIYEEEEYQKKVKKGYVKDRNKYTKTGPQKKGGAPFDKSPPNSRARSSPVGFGGLEEEVDAESFNTHDTLEPRIWNTDENTMKPIIRDRLMKIAQNFIDELPVEVNIEDITLTGSLANFNWSNYSDVDLHIIVDFLGVDENRDLIKSFFDNARMKWNNKHEIRVKGYDVEVYVEDARENHASSGVYSILKDEWLVKPRKYTNNIDFPSARRKSDDIEFQVNIAANLITAGKLKVAMKNIKRLKQKIRNMRKAGLESRQQEFSIENIAFKILRRNGILDYLEDLRTKAYDEMMSLKEE
jgi:hypothetical protein